MKMVDSHYQKLKERLWKEACERYQELSEEEKGKRQRKARERDQHLTEEEEKSVIIIMNVRRTYLSIEEIIT